MENVQGATGMPCNFFASIQMFAVTYDTLVVIWAYLCTITGGGVKQCKVTLRRRKNTKNKKIQKKNYNKNL